ncbi:MAG: NAD(P)/FAD-dependent oxidoreductase, partial [Rhodospirillaceae bacterium]|nr:NAD(P)/FAD-dependent oxidoreductase [Rhodospirillaceae bacterium]
MGPRGAAPPRIVIVGAGFGGLAAAKGLRRAPAEVIVIDARNHHLFQPLLYQVATAGLSPAQIAWPIRSILRDQANAEVVLDRVVGIDRAGRTLRLAGRTEPLAYDTLVLATGARHAYFGHADWEPYAPGLKTVEDATAIRRRVLLAFERAESCADEAERARLMTFVIVGAGPTGVELAGALAELARRALARDFRRIDPRAARILLVEMGPRVLAAFPPRLSAVAQRDLEGLGVEVLLGRAVERVDAEGVVAAGTRIAARTVLWAAGVQASGAGRWLGAETDRAGRVRVGPDLALPGDPAVFVIGDTATVVQPDGAPVPGVAAAAKQQGRYVAVYT